MFSQKLCFLLLLGVVVSAIFWDKFKQNNVIRVCLNSQVSNFQSQCVLCNANLYYNTISGCTAQNFLPSNLSQSQALCIVNLCQSQVNSNQVYLGRKKRHIHTNWNQFSELFKFKTEFVSISEKEL